MLTAERPGWFLGQCVNTSLPSLHNGHLSEAAADVWRSAKWSSRDVQGGSALTLMAPSVSVTGGQAWEHTHTHSQGTSFVCQCFLETNDGMPVMSNSRSPAFSWFSGCFLENGPTAVLVIFCFFFLHVLIHMKRGSCLIVRLNSTQTFLTFRPRNHYSLRWCQTQE